MFYDDDDDDDECEDFTAAYKTTQYVHLKWDKILPSRPNAVHQTGLAWNHSANVILRHWEFRVAAVHGSYQTQGYCARCAEKRLEIRSQRIRPPAESFEETQRFDVRHQAQIRK